MYLLGAQIKYCFDSWPKVYI